MNKFIYILTAAALAAGCSGNKSATSQDSTAATVVASTDTSQVAPNPDAAIMEFENVKYDFGKIKEGEKISYTFKFKNSGKSPLIITNATATCGCTTPTYPHEPIVPGATGNIDVTFNSTGKSGMQDKVITVTSNASPAVNEVHLTGEVTAKSTN
ncbi:DUF1573 domain-containing protein [Hufsiella ginkgonis]|uniref:DUF1573 domain-containing protein n=1 Tax=Hufsiella ginkgonis TaxID=2695274 RepID=A0A7K1XZH4_9SPHI|nr:DUF1573 domain-containing protein [Hufsiella ginkgonis]MXV16415.1 DUF1573 domain-containing protein [Hufsiella ginkgonis]